MSRISLNYTFIEKKSDYSLEFDQKISNLNIIDTQSVEEIIVILQNLKVDFEKYYNYFKNKNWNFSCSAQIINSFNNGEQIALNYLRVSISKNDISFFKELLINENIKNKLKEVISLLDEEIEITINNNKYESSSYFLLSPSASAYYIHEIFGHTFEKDSPLYHKIVQMYQGEKTILDKSISIFDEANYTDKTLNFGEFDDDGKKNRREYIIRNGRLYGQITKKRRGNFSNNSCFRMTNLILDSKKNNVSLPSNYIYLDYAYQGYVNLLTGDFSLTATKGTVYKNNKKIDVIYNITIKGRVFDLFNNIYCVNNDSEYVVGTCIKQQQNLIVGMQSPTLFVAKQLQFNVN